MSELDDVLRRSFARIAEPGDPAGVADALRARMAAGDTGTPAATSGFSSGAGWVVPWLFGGALLAIGGLLLGASGILPTPFAPAASSQSQGLLQHSTDALDCPGGTPVATLVAGNRVLAVARSDDGAYVGVRNPFDTASTVWLPTDIVYPDSGQESIESLPVEACPVVEISEADPTPTAAPQPTETQTPTAPTGDRTAPTLGTPTATPPDDVCADDGYSAYYAISSTIAVTAADNLGVAGVSISWTGASSGNGQMVQSGGSWTFVYNPPQATPSGTVSFTLQARDAAGNLSSTKQTSVEVIDAGGCLI